MAKYTTEVRSICETYAGYNEQQGLSNVSQVISKALPKLFDFDFPIYDENYRTVLETKIVKHFYTREIGYETVGRWKLALDERLNLIMPYYNQRYKSTLLDFNPLYDVDLTTDHGKDTKGNKENNGSHENTTDNNRTYSRTDKYERDLAESNDYTRNLAESNTHDRNLGETDDYTRNLNENTDYTRNLANSETGKDDQNNWEYYSDTPQGGIEGLENNNYLTNATHNVNSDNNSSNGTETGTTNTKLAQTGTDSHNIAQTGTESNTISQTGTATTTASQTGTDTRNINDTDDTSISEAGTTKGTETYTDTESYLEHVKGKSAGTSYSKMLTEYRQTFINIDNEIINQLNDLFINLW